MNDNLKNVIRGIAITPPLLGRITMGHTELRSGDGDERGVPVKDDHFTVTTLCQRSDRSWEVHPLQGTLMKANDKLTRIAVRIAYNDPGLTLQNSYSCFDTDKKTVGRVLCTGDGEKARRVTDEGVKQIACPRPEGCEYAQRFRCKNMSRIYLQVDGQDDDLGVFVLRSTSWNTLTCIAGRLARLAGLTGGNLAGMPLMLELKCKTTARSFRKPIYYADLVFRPGMDIVATVKAAREYQGKMAAAELNLEEMEAAIRTGIANGDFADEIEDADEWVSDDDLVAMAGAGGGAVRGTGMKGLDAVMDAVRAAQASVPAAPALSLVAGGGGAEAPRADGDPAYNTTARAPDGLPPLPPQLPQGAPVLAMLSAPPPPAEPTVPAV